MTSRNVLNVMVFPLSLHNVHACKLTKPSNIAKMQVCKTEVDR